MSRVGNINDIDDLVQEVFTRLLRVRDVELVRDPLAYLFGIAMRRPRVPRDCRFIPSKNTWWKPELCFG
jgi:hypothetical protein